MQELSQNRYRNAIYAREGLTVVEVGSAPGDWVARMYERRRYQPFGIEYAVDGAAVNRAVFTRHGIDASRVIHEDFLAESLHVRLAEKRHRALARLHRAL